MKRKFKITENTLTNIIQESINRVLRESLSSWQSVNNSLFNMAVKMMGQYVMSNTYVEVFENATDLQECDYDEIQSVLAIAEEDDGYSTCRPFSIKALIAKKTAGYDIPIIENLVKEDWRNVLDDELVDAIYDRMGVSRITGKNMYGGGEYEALRAFEKSVAEWVAEKIKEENR